jgi:hypothetical protein
MRNLSLEDAATLTQVICFPAFSNERRTKMLVHSSNEAKAVGRILIKGVRKNDKKDYIKLARKLELWAENNTR